MGNQIKFSFESGLNRDISKNKFPSSAYYYLLNGRIITDGDASTYNIISLKGNEKAKIINNQGLVAPERTGFVIIGYTTMLDDIVLFYAEETAIDIDSNDTISIIDVLEYKGDDTYLQREVWNNEGLNFRVDKPIRAVSNYSNIDLQKVYWTDNNNVVRHLNIKQDVINFSPSQFEFLGKFSNEPRISINPTSGSLKQGVIFYAYRLIDLYGNKTVFSQLSDKFYIAKNLVNGSSTSGGDDIYNPDFTYNTGIGCDLTLLLTNDQKNLFSLYDYIEFVSLWMSSNTGVPDITIISRIDISDSNSYSIIDEGTSNYGTLELSEFLMQTSDFTAKDIAIKDNRLFFANITDKYFDLDAELGYYWDARAYRFGSNGKAYLFNINNLSSPEYTLDNNLPAFNSVDETADCINIFNRVNNILSNDYQNIKCKYQDNLTLIGGTGLNIKYSFNQVNKTIGSMSETQLGSFAPDLLLPLQNTNKNLTLQRDEIYRVGIVFFDNKGRQSFVKWIGDIRTPSLKDDTFEDLVIMQNDDINIRIIQLIVEVDNLPIINNQVLDYQIVYVKREEKDKTIVFSGLGENYKDVLDVYRPNIILQQINNIQTTDLVTAILSPEINFNKTKTHLIHYFEQSGKIESHVCIYSKGLGTANWQRDISPDLLTVPNDTTYEDCIRVHKLGNLNGKDIVSYKSGLVEQIKVVPPTESSFQIKVGTYTVANSSTYYIPNSTPAKYVFTSHGTTMVYNQPLSQGVLNDYNYVYGRKNIFESLYGGITYEDRQLNHYIPLSKKTNSSFVYCEYGDTFISMYEYCRNLGEPDYEDKGKLIEWLYFPVETQINLPFRFDDTFSRYYSIKNLGRYSINEDAWVGETTGLQFTGLYQQNPAYNSINTINKFFPKPINFNLIFNNNTLIKYSDVKLGEEDYDKWLEFRPNNSNLANKNYGAINRIIEFSDKLFAFQNNAVSLVSINPRVTQVSEDGVTISLGTGEVIDDFNYLTTDIGCQDNSDIVKSFSGLYWLDKNKKKIYSFDGKLNSVTDMKGIHSYLRNTINENSTFIGVYDFLNSEVIMTVKDNNPNDLFIVENIGTETLSLKGYNNFTLGFKDVFLYKFIKGHNYLLDIYNDFTDYPGRYFEFVNSTPQALYFKYIDNYPIIPDNTIISLGNYIQEKDNFTIAYNEKIQAFTSFYSFLPTLYIKHNKGYFSSNNTRMLYQHDIEKGNYNYFYEKGYPLILTIILNANTQQLEYTNLSYYSEIYNNTGLIERNETLTDIVANNSYQQSDIISLFPKSLSEEGSNGKKYIMHTSSRKIGKDFNFSNLPIDKDEIIQYGMEIYRSLIDNNSTNPLINPNNYKVCELANIRKVQEEWNTTVPRIELDNKIHSNRMRGDYVQLSLIYNPVSQAPSGVTVNSNRRFKLSDLKIMSYGIIH